MENKQVTLLDFLGACLLGAILGGMIAAAILGGF